MAGAVGNYDNNFVTQTQFKQVIDLVVAQVDMIATNVENMQKEGKKVADTINDLKLGLQKLQIYQQNDHAMHTEEKKEKRENKMAIIAFLSAVGSTIMSAVMLVYLGFKN